jgi:hypothetical protein
MGDLGLEVHFDVDLAEADVCDQLQDWLGRVAPRFASRLRVLAYERDAAAIPVDAANPGSLHRAVLSRGLDRGPTFDALAAEAGPTPFARRFGNALVRGGAPKSFLTVTFDEYHPARPMGDRWQFSNSLTGRIGANAIDRVPADAWVRTLVEVFADHPALLWGAAYSQDEFRARNLHDEADGMWALGRDIRRSLPGLFWLNLFGKPYVELIGRDRLSTLPAGSSHQYENAVLVCVHHAPHEWSSPQARDDHEEVVRHVGARYFFDRTDPDATTIAPEFGLADRTDSARPLQAISWNGQDFSILPPAPDSS